jgi:hypothetical protein
VRGTKFVSVGLVAALAVGLAGAAPPALAATGNSPVAINLPEPTGPYPTGTTLVHLRDQNRVDPLDPQGRAREVMAQLWYPAKPAPDKQLAPYAPPGEVAGLHGTYAVPAGAFTATTNSRLGAPVRSGVHKVVFFHHGLCGTRSDATVVNEQLASLGFVVVALGNTHESTAVEFPGGRVEARSDPAFCLTGRDPFSAPNQAILRRLLDVRVADVRFTLDQLDRINRGANPSADGAPLPRGIARSMDTRRVGIFGHSFGGGTAAAVMREDRRFVAGVNLDGFVIGPVATEGLRKPFLVLGSSYHEPGQAPDQDQSWTTFLPALSGWHRWFRLTDAGHYRFIDLGGSVRKWGLEAEIKPNNPEEWRLVFGDIDDALSLEIVRVLVAAFFRQFLLHRPQRILDRPAECYPQIEDRTDLIDG